MNHTSPLSLSSGFASPAGPAATTDEDAQRPESPAEQLERLRRECDLLQSRINQIAQVIGCKDTNKIVHDVRNVMNELVLLRKLVELEE